MFKLCCLCAFILLSQFGFAQPQEQPAFKNNAITWGGSLTSNGGIIGGLGLDYTRVKDASHAHFFTISAGQIKHPKEVRVLSSMTGNTFVYGKANYLFPIRLYYGQQKLLFAKHYLKGARWSFLWQVGPNFGIYAPYLVQYQVGVNAFEAKRFDPLIDSPERVQSVSRLGTAISQGRILPGLAVRTGFDFELSGLPKTIQGFQAGVLLDAYTQPTEIVWANANSWLHSALYLHLFFGVYR